MASERLDESLISEEKVNIEISSQARRILSQSTYSVDAFKKWYLKNKSFTLGGQNVMFFLEAMSRDKNKKVNK
jgi:hypothetical protein